jgi:hypothetical protein
MTTIATKTYHVGVVERALAYYTIQAEDARTAAENWQDGEFIDLDDEALDTEGPCNVLERQPDGSCRKVPPSEWEADSAADDSVKKPYSVLLLYPDYANDDGTETYYALVEAPHPTAAVTLAKRQAVAAQKHVVFPPDDFTTLLVIQGHHHSEPLFNK